MVKAKDLWKELCKVLDYRFFSGVPSLELKSLYDSMSSELMHYIPAANEHIALSMAIGTILSGFNSGVILPKNRLSILNFDFILENELPILIITSDDIKRFKGFSVRKLGKLSKIKGPTILVIKEGELK
jgi:hypothetical protein